jgi:hypothetical protein
VLNACRKSAAGRHNLSGQWIAVIVVNILCMVFIPCAALTYVVPRCLLLCYLQACSSSHSISLEQLVLQLLSIEEVSQHVLQVTVSVGGKIDTCGSSRLVFP